MPAPAVVTTEATHVFPRELDREYPLIVRAEGVWLHDAAGNALLDGVGGGAMVSSLGAGVEEIVEAARRQAEQVSFLYNQQFTSPAQERLAEELARRLPGSLNRVHFVSGGAEANETAVRLVRSYHVERGEPQRTRIVSPAQAYHGPTAVTLGLTGRPSLQHPYEPFIVPQPHVPPATWRLDPTGRASLDALDEVVTGMGRTGTWFAAEQLGFEPDVITTAKGLGAGYAPVGAVACADHVFQAVAEGSREFSAGHTWDGAPLPCAVGLAVVEYLEAHGLVDRVRERGPALRAALEDALAGCEMVREVRGRGFLLGVEYVDPRDGRSFLPPELGVARRIDDVAREEGLVVYSTQPTRDGYVGDQTLLAPAFVSTDAELELLVERMAASVARVEAQVAEELAVMLP
jgi:adenosylmethionine-8-amino-7-oxononanoate aminotransferase